ncbi:hypothetical protein ACR780_02030 [Sphingobacterium faecium]|uniref:hypothetical protein n=1 Tax=Sphingobacterium faecium TaxID=34087 RepID=UPI003DA3F932
MAEQEEEIMWPGGAAEAKSVEDFDYFMTGKDNEPITKIPKSRLAEVIGVVGESMPAIQGGATSAAAVALPDGPIGQNRWFDASWGYWKYNNVVLKNPTGTDGIPEGSDGQLYWNGTATPPTWSISKMQKLPKDPVNGVIEKDNANAVMGGEIWDSFSNVFVEKYDEGDEIVDITETYSTDSVSGVTNYSSVVNNTKIHYNIFNIAKYDGGKIKKAKINCAVAGTLNLVVGKHDPTLAQRFAKRADIGTFNLVVGMNTINLDFDILKDERVGIQGGTAVITWGNYSGYDPGNRFVQSDYSSDVMAAIGTIGAAMTFRVTIAYNTTVVNPIKGALDSQYALKDELPDVSGFTPKTKLNEVEVTPSQGKNAIQSALNLITDNSSTNLYQLNVANGVYKITDARDFIGNIENNYPAMIVPKDYVSIIGQSKSSTIVWAELPHDDAELSSQTSLPRDKFQTIWSWANQSLLKNMTFYGINMRYVLHQDNPNESDKTRYIENCDFIFLGNKGFTRALGIGTYSGSKTYVTGGKSSSPARCSFSIHNNRNFSKPSLWSFKEHYFENLSGATANKEAIQILNSGSMQDCTVELVDCSANQYVINYDTQWLYFVNQNDCFNYANWRVIGKGNTPFFFNNGVVGNTLMVKSISTGVASKVRFDKNSSAYNSIIANPYDYWGELGHPERMIEDKYIIFDGKLGLNGYAIGGKSIIEGNANNGTAYQCSLGKRLGDCSSVNKQLKLNIDGTDYTINFNKNYTSMTNADIISEINVSIGSVAIASEYNIGADYHAEFSDVLFTGMNASASVYIPKGTLVTLKNNRISPCGENDNLYGLAIDDVSPYGINASNGFNYGKGRVIKNCYVTIDAGKIQSVNNSGSGTRYKIVSGQFVADVNGRYILEDSKYILI